MLSTQPCHFNFSHFFVGVLFLGEVSFPQPSAKGDQAVLEFTVTFFFKWSDVMTSRRKPVAAFSNLSLGFINQALAKQVVLPPPPLSRYKYFPC